MPTAPNPALFGHRPALQHINNNITPVNAGPAILPSKSGPRHIAQPTGGTNSLTIHALAARRPAALPIPPTTQPVLASIIRPTPIAVPTSVTSYPVVQPLASIMHPGPLAAAPTSLAAVPASLAAHPLVQPPVADTPHPNPALEAAPASTAAHSPGQPPATHISPSTAPNIPIDPRLMSQETEGSVTGPQQTPEPATHLDDDLWDVSDVNSNATMADVDAEVQRLRKIIADQKEKYALAVAAGKILPEVGFYDAPMDSIPKPPQLYKKSLLTAMGFSETDKEVYNCMRSVVRGCMSYCATNYQRKWMAQDPIYVEKVVNVARSRCPELARYQGGWAVKSMMCSSGKYKRRADVLKKCDPLGTNRKARAEKMFAAKMMKFLSEQRLVLAEAPAVPEAALPAAVHSQAPVSEDLIDHSQAPASEDLIDHSQAPAAEDFIDDSQALAAEDFIDHSQALDAAELFAVGHQDECDNTIDDYTSFNPHFPAPNDITPLADIQPATLLIHSTHPLPPVEAAFVFNETPVPMPNVEPVGNNLSQVHANPLDIATAGPSATATISNIQTLAGIDSPNEGRVLRKRPASNTQALAAKRIKPSSRLAQGEPIHDSEEKGEGEGEGEGEGKGKGKGKGKAPVGRGRGGGSRGGGRGGGRGGAKKGMA